MGISFEGHEALNVLNNIDSNVAFLSNTLQEVLKQVQHQNSLLGQILQELRDQRRRG